MYIEPLEARIAPAAIVRFTDVDGDLVILTTSKGTNSDLAQLLSQTGALVETGLGYQLAKIDFSSRPMVFAGTDVTFTASPQDLDPADGKSIKSGDGLVNVAYINANGINLGNVSVDGDLEKLVGGSGTAAGIVKSLTVGSLGVQGTSTGAPDAQTIIYGTLGAAKIKGDLDRAYLYAARSLGSVSVGGDIIGTSTNQSGSIYAAMDLGPVTVKGNVLGSSGPFSGSIIAGGKVGNVTIGGSLLGGGGENSGTITSGRITAASTMGAIKIGHDLAGGHDGASKSSGRIVASGDVASITIGGSVIAGVGASSGQIQIGGNAGAIAITGSLLAEDGLENAGSITANIGTVKSLSIGGSVVGGRTNFTGYITISHLDSLRIGGDLRGGAGAYSGWISVGDGLGSATIVGSIVGGVDSNTTDSATQGSNSGFLSVGGDLGKLAIGGSILGLNCADSGMVNVAGKLGSLTVSGDVQAGSGARSGFLAVTGVIGTATIRGSILGEEAASAGYVRGSGGIGKITVGGSVVGGSGDISNSGFIDAGTGRLGSVSIVGDLVGNRAGAPDGTNTGVILARQIGSVTLGGSILAGAGGAGTTALSGAIVADEDIGSIVIKGSVTGISGRAKIYAGASATAPAESNFGIKSLTIGGNVSSAAILAGVNRSGTGTDGDAQIGAVKVGGQWKTSILASGVKPVNGNFGDGDDTFSTANPHSKIASIVIGGPVLGSPGGTLTFGFAAHEIGSFKYNGIAVALLAGAGNDQFGPAGSNQAKAVGPSTAPSTAGKPDGFAVHVYEV